MHASQWYVLPISSNTDLNVSQRGGDVNAGLMWLNIRVRSAMPNSIKSAYRLARSFQVFEPSKDIPAAQLKHCRVVASRIDLLDELPKGARVAELGTYRGDFARHILERASPSELHLIDIDYSHFDETGLTGTTVRRHIGLTVATLESFAPDYFDWIYVDANHSFDAVLADARAGAIRVRPGGYLVFNDFAHIDPFLGRYGVHRAVCEFAVDTGWPVAFLAMQSAGLYDIVLRRPAID